MRIRLCAFLVLTIAFAGCKDTSGGRSSKDYLNIVFTEKRPAAGADEKWYVCWGETKDGLAFVLFEDRTPPGAHGVASSVNSDGRNEGWLLKPDGTKVQLPTEAQLHEVIGGQYRQCEGRVTVEQLKAFLESNPKEYTVDALLRFTERGAQSSPTTRPL